MNMDPAIQRLVDQRWELENSFGGGAFHDGLVRQRIETIDRKIRHLRGLPCR